METMVQHVTLSLLIIALVIAKVTLAQRSQPNIVFILADDLGWNDVGFHGSEIRTPNLDRLASDGVILDQYYVQPICTPSRSQLMSGLYQIHTGLQHSVLRMAQRNGLPLQIPTLPQLLQKLGYSTHMVGKWHLGFFKKEYTPTYRGFESHFGYLGGTEDYYNHTYCVSIYGTQACGVDFRDNLEPGKEYLGNYTTHLFVKRAEKIMRDHARKKTDKPLFLYLPFHLVHAPLEAPEEYVKPYESVIVNKKRRIFAGMVSCLDEAVGNITRQLKKYGLWDNTLLIFSTDNGGQPAAAGNNWPLRGCKNTTWEGGVRGVGFVHGRGIKTTKGKSIKELIHVSDWLPTLVTLAGGNVSTLTLDGVDAWPSISEGSKSLRGEILHNIDPLTPPVGERLQGSPFDNRIRAALRSGRWKILTGYPGMDRWIPPPKTDSVSLFEQDDSDIYNLPVTTKNIWLFDVVSDPTEMNDLSEARADVVMKLLETLAKYNNTAVKCRYPSYDPHSDPVYHRGMWGPWVGD